MNRLLILDDNRRFADALKDNIADFDNYETEFVEVTYTPTEAIELARRAAENQQPFTVFLIDQNLDADMDGIQTMKELLAIRSEADAIILTGFETPQDGMRAYEEGASRYLPKPFEPKELAFILKDLSRSRKVRLEEARQRRRFQVAARIAEAVGASLNLETTMDAVLETLYETFEKTKLCVLLYDKREKALRFAPATLKYYEIQNPDYLQQDTFPLDRETIACRVARQTLKTREMKCENVGNVAEDADYANLNPSTKSECCVGLLNSKSELLGVLALEREWLNGFGEDDLDLIKMAAQHISIAIERAQQSEDLEYNSTVAMRTSWVAALTHDIGNMVGNILNWAYFIRKLAPENPQIQEYAKKIEENIVQLSASNPWINQPPTVVEIDQMLESTLNQMTSLRNIEVIFQLSAPEVKVKIRTVQFQHVLKHLVNNASQAMLEQDEKKIYVSTWLSDDNQVSILFRDSGKGLSEEQHRSAFRRRFSTKETGGYGLLFVRQMIEEMNGEIALLRYREGEGANFLIHLPVAESAPLQGG